MASFYHIHIQRREDVTFDQVKEAMNIAVDWYRYNEREWILYTTSDAKTWYSRLQPLVEPGGEILIVKLDVSDYWGTMPKGLWTWLSKTR
jgi:hypothetical protein